MNAASVVSTSSSSHRNVRMMFDMMPSDPLPAITFATLRSNFSAKPFPQIEPAVGIVVEAAEDSAQSPPAPAARGPADSHSKRAWQRA